MRSYFQNRAGLILIGLAVFSGRAAAQGPAMPASSPAQETADMLSSLPKPLDVPRSMLSPAIPEGPPRAIVPDHYFEEDPLLDVPQLPSWGWFAGAEASLVGAHTSKTMLQNSVPFAGRMDTIALQGAPLDWTVSPRVEIGYRLPSGFGEFSLSYRFLTTDGSESAQFPTGPASLSSGLSTNTFDFDYASHELSLGDNWVMKWRSAAAWRFSISIRKHFRHSTNLVCLHSIWPSTRPIFTRALAPTPVWS